MSFKDSLTPKDTEEIKPGFFIQKKGDTYRQINPIVWKGNWNLKKQFSWKNLFVIILVLFIAYSYHTNTKACEEFQANPCEHLQNLSSFCLGNEMQRQNLDYLGGDEVDNERGDTPSLQNNP